MSVEEGNGKRRIREFQPFTICRILGLSFDGRRLKRIFKTRISAAIHMKEHPALRFYDELSRKLSGSKVEEIIKQLEIALESNKKAEEQIEKSLNGKEVLLREVHHRVKNNLQIISSLLRLQSRRIEDKQALEMFKDTQNRVKSMALIHDRLYQSKDLAIIDFAAYINGLTGNLFRSYNQKGIKLDIEVKDIFLDINTGVPCGLIISELVSNSLKHAFPGGKNGKIQVGLYKLPKNGDFTLIVSDNGVGFPECLDSQNTESLGLQLVTALVEQLDGTIELDRGEGTSFTLKFKELKYEARM